MTSDLDNYRSAKLIIDKYGVGAAAEAERQADAFLKRGDAGGHAVWTRILRTVEELGRVTPADGERTTSPLRLGLSGPGCPKPHLVVDGDDRTYAQPGP